MLDKIIELASLNGRNCEIKDDEDSWKRNEKRDCYYKNALTKIHNGKWFVWNWSAFLCEFMWLSYRKMYINSMICMIGPFILNILFFSSITFVSKYLPIQDMNIMPKEVILLNLICMFLLGFFGNKFYYHHLKRKIEKGYDETIYDPVNAKIKTLVKISSFFLFFGVFYEVLTFLTSIHMLYDFMKTKESLNKYIQKKRISNNSI